MVTLTRFIDTPVTYPNARTIKFYLDNGHIKGFRAKAIDPLRGDKPTWIADENGDKTTQSELMAHRFKTWDDAALAATHAEGIGNVGGESPSLVFAIERVFGKELPEINGHEL